MTEMLTETAARTLRRRVRGAVIEPGGAGWEDATRAFNLSFVQTPTLTVVPQGVQDVVEVIDFARESGYQVAPQRTGHNAEPLGEMEGVILLKTDALQGVTIDAEARSFRARAGAKWEDVVPQASDLGLAALHGSTPDVSIAGYSLGGGVGWYARKLGLSTNSVTAIELVTPDGAFRRVDLEHEPELFWALRGGGGSFGVVTALEARLFPIPEVYAGVLFFPWERSAEVLHAWNEWTPTTPDEVTSVGRILQLPPLPEIPEPLRGRQFVVVEAIVIGDEAMGSELLAPLRALGPEIDTIELVPPVGIAELHMDPPTPLPYVGDGQMLGALPAGAIDALVEAAGPGSGSPLVSVEVRQLGGALQRPAPDHGALATLDAPFMTFGIGVNVDEAAARANRAQLDLVAEALTPYDNGRRYLNFAEEPTDPARFYRDETYRRLREVKAAYDPLEVMRSNHPIPPAS